MDNCSHSSVYMQLEREECPDLTCRVCSVKSQAKTGQEITRQGVLLVSVLLCASAWPFRSFCWRDLEEVLERLFPAQQRKKELTAVCARERDC